MNPAQLLEHFSRISEAPDAVARLRRFILDLAVRGKLVEQDPSDEPAAELLKRIQAEKARLVKDGEIRKQLELSQVSTDEQLFEAPISWMWARFGEIADFSAGRTPSRHNSSFWNTGDYPWVSIADMKNGETIVSTKETVSEKAKTQVFGSAPPSVGTLIMSFKLTIGKIARLGIPAFHNEAIISIRPHLTALDAYLFMVLPQFSRQGDTKGAIKGATLNRESITNILLPLPPLAEQHRIVAKVDELMALCDQLETAQSKREKQRDRLVAASLHRVGTALPESLPVAVHFHLDNLPRLTTRLEHIKQLRQTILNLAVRGRLVPQDPNDEPAAELLKRIQAEKNILTPRRKGAKKDATKGQENLGEGLPASWGAADLSDYALDICTGPFGSALHQSDYIKGGIPLVNPSHMVNDRIVSDEMVSVPTDIADRLSSYRLEPGDVVMARRGEVGRAALVEPHQKGWLCGTGSFYLRFSQEINRRFFLLLLRSVQFRSYLAGKAVGTTMVNLNHNILNKAWLEVPPLAEQSRIVAKVDELMALCDQLEAQLATTQTDSHRLLEAVLCDALDRSVVDNRKIGRRPNFRLS